ncbi:MAG: hypothetical protein Q8R38_06685 [Candidatus Omnitrophota bacterium]|nr:hypothetical protein [Candidatus Omnitrophota bacterium]
MTLAIVLTLAVSYQFVAMIQFGNAIQDKAEPVREAYVIMNHMTNMLRFAKNIQVSNSPEWIRATIEGGHIDAVSSDTVYYYQANANYCLYFYKSTTLIPDPNENDVLSRNVTCLQSSWSSSNNLLIIKLEFEKNGSTFKTETRICPLET